MQRKLLFFINPISGVRNKKKLEEKIVSKCMAEGALHEILYTNKEGNYDYLPQKVSDNQVTDVIICGGDGSISPIVSHLLNISVNIGIIPLGSGNGLARSAGISPNLNRSLNIVFTGTPKYVDAFLVNNKLGCQITGFGFDALIAGEFAKERKRGLSTYTQLAVKNFLKARTYEFEISADNLQINLRAFIVCVSNANQFGNNLKIAPRASLQDGLLDLVILKQTSKMSILVSFVNHLIFGKKISDIPKAGRKHILYFNTSEVTILNRDMAPIHIDGDPVDPMEKFDIKILPSAYKLIHPA